MGSEFEDISKIPNILERKPNGMCIRDMVQELHLHRNTVSKYLEMLHFRGDVSVKQFGTAKVFFRAKRLPESAIVNFVPDPYIIFNSRLQVKDVDKLCLKLFCSDKNAFIGKKLGQLPWEFFGRDDFPELCMRALDGEISSMKISEEISGKKRHLIVRFLPVVLDNRRDGISVIFSDMTRYISAVSSPECPESRYREIVESQTWYICRFLPDGTYSFVNNAFCRFVERPREEVIGHKGILFVLDRDREALSEAQSSITASDPVHSVEFRVIEPGGRISWQRWRSQGIFTPQGHLIEYQATGYDITENKHAGEELEIRIENLENILRHRTAELLRVEIRLKEEIELHR